MGINTKETITILWRILATSTTRSFGFMTNHPILSSVSMFLLLLYIFLPSLLFFLIYSSPILACALVYAREKLGLRFSSSKHRSPRSPRYGDGDNGSVRCHLRQQRSVRRNARMKVEEWDSQTSEDEKDKVILTSLYNDLLGRTPNFEESPKALQDDETPLVVEPEENNSLLDVVEKVPMPCCDCEIKEEEKREEISNVINEHGISEIERNRRLESLIARRKARRLFKLALDQRHKLQAEEPTHINNNNNNLQITLPRNNYDKRRSYPPDTTSTGLQIPGSAPSVMSQGRNPFDIPYDPQEERPILTGDSFDEEFSLFNHKDMFFCRHESFCRFALFSPEQHAHMNSPVPASDISNTRKVLDLDNEYMDQDHTEEKCRENDNKSAKSGKSNNETDPEGDDEEDDSSCSEESETELNRLNNVELREAIYHSMDNYPGGGGGSQTRNNIPNTLPRGLVPPRLDDNSLYYPRRCGNSHSRTFSVASDMQVEVSEIGSPPTTVDWLDDWSTGGESYIYDTDIEREIVRNEESRKKVSEDNTGSQVVKPEMKSMSDEQLRAVESIRSQSDDIFPQKASSSSDMSKTTSSGKLFHTSASLSSITEEPEIVSEHMSIDSSMEKLIDKEVADVQRFENVEQCESPKIVDDQEEDIKKYENTDSREDEAILDASLDTPEIETSIKVEEGPKLDIFTEDSTKKSEDEAIQSDLKSSPGEDLMELLQSEDNNRELVVEEETKQPTEQEETHNLLKESSSLPYTQLVEENASDDVMLMQVQDADKLSTDKEEVSKEEENQELLKGFSSESAQEFNDIANVQEESIVLRDSPDSQDSQSLIQQMNSSPRTLETVQQTEQEDVIVKDEIDAVAKDLAASESNDEENLKPNEEEAIEKEVEVGLKSVQDNIGLVAKEEDEEETKKVNEAIHSEEVQTPQDENRVLEV